VRQRARAHHAQAVLLAEVLDLNSYITHLNSKFQISAVPMALYLNWLPFFPRTDVRGYSRLTPSEFKFPISIF
jgi:hypothetical protein